MSKRVSDADVVLAKRLELEALESKLSLIEGLPHLHGWKWYKWARQIFESNNREIFCTAANQISKAVHVKTEIPTPNGFVKMEELKIGDFVFDRNGEPTEVIDIPFLGYEESFEIEFNDFSKVIACKNHDWIAKGYEERFRREYTVRRGKRTGVKYPNPNFDKWKIYSTKEMIEKGKYSPETSAPKRFSIPVTEACEFKEANVFDPYFVGLYIGNGSEHSLTFHNDDTDVSEYCLKYGNKYNTEKLVIGVLKPTKDILDSLGLRVSSYERQIPTEYLRASVRQRLDLLQGLMDTDGTCSQAGTNYSYSTISPVLAKQVLELVCSLGGIGQIKQYPSSYKKDGDIVPCRDHYVVTVWTKFNPFRSKRKSALWRLSEKYKHERVVTKITPIGQARVKCITVASEDGSFLCTRDYIVTHNSSTAIRKNIELAGNPDSWKRYWPLLPPQQKPNQFWYFYPTFEVATVEFESKWVPLFLPKGAWKDHATYGWKEEYNKNYISNIRFNSGVTIYFKSYEQKVSNLQTGSVYMATLDEEAPEHLLPEIFARLNATDGLLLSVFTATLGQLYWEQTMEPKSTEEERHKDALKLQVSVYDCMQYEDGTPSHWTLEKIKRAEARCTSEAERLRRIMGRFVKSEGLRFHGFDRGKNFVKPHPLPRHWHIYTGVDPGSGGSTGHPAGIVFLAVSPDFQQGRVFRAWRGDGVPTTSQDTLNKYKELRRDLKPVLQVYDYASKDFFLVASRQGETFTQANKDRDSGFGLLNVLFKSGMLKVQGEDPELEKLVSELCSIPATAKKSDHFVDDLCDALRYAAEAVPWDFSVVKMEAESVVLSEEPKEEERTAVDLRREWFMGPREESDEISDELDYWNDMAGT